ncbi:tryptophan synthase subunit alpha [Candidatus Blochmannia ocreatus (nom. nud.)]|uniref:Tryptophan synthase alpha chain n=1 Tax=Candidatus Blochmannia ocreatus (nom. nud.) TaxID=251538 RepID=A0ABY4SSH4_9ENTR|nr:tryptophan synthase subunit alpha [Candidatus Blochmannia ocreatus]URJ24929.1 tryptophan synthase subunit alpha [Candidatus Blochmannia ocreatus]
MNRYKKLFKFLNKKKSGAFVPFVTVGDPDPIIFMKIVNTLITSGADAIELGIPFSDPISDGPIIQRSIERAFKSGINLSNCLSMINTIRKNYPYLPLGLLIYSNLIFKKGLNNFYTCCSNLNIDSVLIPDLPLEESKPFCKISAKQKISQIFICPTNADEKLIQNIISKGQGYIYLLSRPGITGIQSNTENDKIEHYDNILHKLIISIKKQKNTLPILQGFGIYTPNQAKKSLLLGTSGIIVGSAIAQIIEENIDHSELILKKLQKFVFSMKRSMKII